MAMIFRQPGKTGIENYKNMDLSIKNKNHINKIVSNRNKRMKLNSTIFFLCAGLCSSTFINNAFSMNEDSKGKLDQYTKFLASRHLESASDHVNLAMSTPVLKLNMEKFHYNPIALTVDNTHLFPNIQTVVLKHDDNISEIINQLCEDVLDYHVTGRSDVIWDYYLNQSNNIYFDAAKHIVDNINKQEEFAAFMTRINAGIISEKELNGLKDNKIERRILELLDLYNMFKKYGIHGIEEYIVEQNPGLYNRDFYKSFLRDRHFRILQHQLISFIELVNGANKANLHKVTYNHNTGEYDVQEYVDCGGMGVEEVPANEITRKEINALRKHGVSIVDIVNNHLTNVKSIGETSFLKVNELTDVVIPGNIESIGRGAFAQCEGIRSIQLNEGLKSIGYAAFERLAIESITIPNSVVSIGRAAFTNCAQLKSISIPSSVKEIRQETFYKCAKLKNVIIENGITNIGYQAFAGCNELEHVEIPGSVTQIDMSAFSGCIGLKSVVIHDGVEVIGDSMFGGCTELSSVVLPNTLKKIGSGAFADAKLKEIHIPDSVREIDANAFANCTELESVKIPYGVTSIGCFAKCTKLTSVDIPDTVKEIDYYAFQGCSSLRSLELPDSIQEVGELAFDGCDNLQNINIRCRNGVISQDDRTRIIELLRVGGVDADKVKFIDANGNEI